MLKRYVIERDLPGVGSLSEGELGGAARTSNGALTQVAGIQWQHSYVTADKTFCIYLADAWMRSGRTLEFPVFLRAGYPGR